jgi:hypothetical protein
MAPPPSCCAAGVVTLTLTMLRVYLLGELIRKSGCSWRGRDFRRWAGGGYGPPGVDRHGHIWRGASDRVTLGPDGKGVTRC